MIAKKNPKVDLEKKRAAIFNVGLLVAGSFTLAAFSYTETAFSEAEKLTAAVEKSVIFEVDPKEPERDPIKTNQPQPQNDQNTSQEQNLGSQTGLAENIAETENGNEGVKQPDGPGVFGFSIPYTTVEIKDVDDIVIPDIDAKYVGGTLEMVRKIQTEIEYPDIDRVMGNQGKVYVSFVVEKDGSVTHVKVERGISETLDREAERIVKSFPKWIPGEDKWGPVRTRVRLPITFLLN